MDPFWDPASRLLTYPSRVGSGSNPYQQPGVPIVRETTTYALGLLARGADGDRERAVAALGEVLRFQIDDPDSVCHGTWRRSPLEPEPGPEPREWIDYDPNWREFIGTELILALEHFEPVLPKELIERIEHALNLAAIGTTERQVPAEYTNIALMSAFFLDWVGERLGVSGWRERGDSLGREVADRYRVTGAFPEHNSPTYYGVDLYGAALWRAHAVSPTLRKLGREIEAALWRDLSRFYHAGLRNLCGPYSRAYGMDMTRYVGWLGHWIALAVPGDVAPLPGFGDDVDHGHDFCMLPAVGLLGSRPPDDVRDALTAFPGERRIEQVISERPRRVATAWLAEDVMLGGEHTSGHVIHWQHHPATLHWRLPAANGDPTSVGWLRLVTTAPVDAVAEPNRLSITIHSGLSWLRTAEIPVWLEASPAPAPAARLEDGAVWEFPGMRLHVAVAGGGPSQTELQPDTDRGRAGFVLAPGQAPDDVVITLRVDLP